jgi:hypothetical protein
MVVVGKFSRPSIQQPFSWGGGRESGGRGAWGEVKEAEVVRAEVEELGEEARAEVDEGVGNGSKKT